MRATPELLLPLARSPWPHERHRWRELLRAAPWCWPEDRCALTLAQELSGLSAPPPLQPGQVPVLTVGAGETHATLWSFGSPNTGQDVRLLAGAACEAWRAARSALPRSLPFLWRSVSVHWSRTTQSARRLNALYFAHSTHAPDLVLDGASIGLSSALSLASSVLGVAVPGDVAASAAIEPSGELRPVRGIPGKVACARACAPRVRRLLVHPDNVAEAVAAAEEGVEVIGVVSIAEAISQVWGDTLEQHLCALSGDGEQQRDDLADALFHLALGDRSAAAVWTPIARTANLALEQWPVTDRSRQRLEFARDVALRHDCNRGSLRLPDDGLLNEMPAPQREAYCAHVVQQAADAGSPPWQEAEALALRRLHGHRGLEATAGHLRLLGALGRLYAVVGRAEKALELQQEAARGWLTLRMFDQVCYPLSECYRLAGTLRDEMAFEAADDVAARVGEGGPYAVLARGRALTELCRDSAARLVLNPLVQDGHVPAYLRWGALRALFQGASAEARERLTAARLALDEACTGDGTDADDARLAHCLIALDEAVKAGDRVRADIEMSNLLRCERYPTRHLVNAAQQAGQDTFAYVARYYPY